MGCTENFREGRSSCCEPSRLERLPPGPGGRAPSSRADVPAGPITSGVRNRRPIPPCAPLPCPLLVCGFYELQNHPTRRLTLPIADRAGERKGELGVGSEH